MLFLNKVLISYEKNLPTKQFKEKTERTASGRACLQRQAGLLLTKGEQKVEKGFPYKNNASFC